MSQRAERISQITIRSISITTLVSLGLMMACEKFSSTHCRAFANSSTGRMVTFWTIATSLLLPLCVGCEALWMHTKKNAGKNLWIDATLAGACFFLLCAVVLYSWGTYAMF